MARITTIINQKGGVGKTSTAHALAMGLIRRGYSTLVVDADPQGNLSYIMQANTESGIYDAMKGTSTEGLIQHTAQGDILASTPSLIGTDLEFTQTGREYVLRDALEPVTEIYSHIIIDSPPTLGIMTINALTASTDIIIPMGADIFSLQGLGQLYDTIGKVKRYCNPALQIAGLLITRYTRRAVLTRDLTEVIGSKAQQISAHVFNTKIREGIAVKEAQTMRTSIFESHPKANPTADYSALIDEYLTQEDKIG